MTVIDFQCAKIRKATKQPLYERQPERQIRSASTQEPMTAHIIHDGPLDEMLTVLVQCPNSSGTYRRTAKSRDFIGCLFRLAHGAEAQYRGHFKVKGCTFARMVTSWRVIHAPLSEIVLLPDHPKGAA